MQNPDRRKQRQDKRDIKRRGNKKLRADLKRDLLKNPEDTHLTAPDHHTYSSRPYNGMDDDPTRRRKNDRE